MKNYFVVTCSLLLFSTTVTFAQMGNVVKETSTLAGDRNDGPAQIPQHLVFDRMVKLAVDQPVTIGNAAIGGAASLTLKNNALVMERIVTGMLMDIPHTDTKQVWSIPFSGSAKELEFLPDGDLVVRDSANKVLWASTVSASIGKRLVMDFTGKLQIFDREGRVLWEK
ncbi:hypothetical protein GK091_24310 [Spirosoma agri]|uniref:Bulb-type lectin domain-containing protein n=1 Tax=Spirosoma agri TaxID=1987381 RepID=A0A6M0IP04_9BACT|nr:hypothetical protein [Spirosoma agri]NEU70026.1 hypothetical protein [Spirosoma agri]